VRKQINWRVRQIYASQRPQRDPFWTVKLLDGSRTRPPFTI